jgi:hypothetical protein
MINGSNAVTEIDTASLIHQLTIHKAVARTAVASKDKVPNGKLRTIIKSKGPAKSPIFFERGCVCIKNLIAL